MRPDFARPYAITMWDFSWLERRWPGAGFEDWDQALDELTSRGYDAVRIDAFPHLVAADPDREWELLPNWNQQSWGAQSIIRVRPMPALLDFLRAARRHGVRVSLSSWFREDRDNTRIRYDSPERFAQMWISTLRAIDEAGLLVDLLFVDLCNEFPLQVWAPWLYTEQLAANAFRGAHRGGAAADTALETVMPPEASRLEPRVSDWMRDTIGRVREVFPGLDLTYSFSSELSTWRQQDVSALDVLEPHVWLANNDYTDYYDRVGYDYEPFVSTGFDNVVARGRQEYLADRSRYDAELFRMIDTVAEWSRATGKGLYITECWSLVDYKDWPGLEWDWILDINARAVEHASATGRFVGMATSNFCGPQFVGMWREVDWHRRLTDVIKSSPVDPDLRRP